MFSNIKSALLTVTMLFISTAWLVGCEAGPPATNLAVAKEKAEQCVEPTDDMRRNHMVYLDKHRDATMLEGIRTKQHSLNECINCHVPKTDSKGEPMHYDNQEHFCATCHTYAGVKIDCFQCHRDRPELAEQANYQHKVGSLESYHYVSNVSKASAPSLQDMMTVTGVQEAVQDE